MARVDQAKILLTNQLQRYDDAYHVAAATSRKPLAQPVVKLQTIQRETTGIPVPACLETAKNELILMMDAAIEGFLAFMAQESDPAISVLLDSSIAHRGTFNNELLVVDACKPFCRTR
jgi:hypothetical protein